MNQDKIKNPMTGRMIQVGGATHKRVVQQMGGDPTKCAVTGKTWNQLNDKEADEYELPATVTCKNCNKYTKRLHFVHDPAGDYLCSKKKCNQEGNLAYYCYKCKNTVVVDE